MGLVEKRVDEFRMSRAERRRREREKERGTSSSPGEGGGATSCRPRSGEKIGSKPGGGGDGARIGEMLFLLAAGPARCRSLFGLGEGDDGLGQSREDFLLLLCLLHERGCSVEMSLGRGCSGRERMEKKERRSGACCCYCLCNCAITCFA